MKQKNPKNFEDIRTDTEKPIQCICPQCGYETFKEGGLYCTSMKCPVCKTKLINK